MGAEIRTEGHHAVVRGMGRLSAAPVRAHDVRAGAALVLAGLVADGETVISDAHHVDRGYEALDAKLAALGASLLVWRHPLAALMARAAAPIGATFCAVCLVTGSLWGRPMWGTYWVWDARLTSMLLLFFLFLGHIALSNAYDNPERGDRAAAILALVGVINVPIIKFSVDWWNTLHQPASVMKLGGPAIHPTILAPLLVMAVALLLLFVTLVLLRTDTEIDRRRLEIAELGQ